MDKFNEDCAKIRTFDPDFTELTPSEAEELKQIIKEVENGEYVNEDEIDWG